MTLFFDKVKPSERIRLVEGDKNFTNKVKKR